MTERMNQTVELRDGRTLGFAEYGDPNGTPVLYFHGHPSSRLEYPLFDPEDAVSELGVRLIAPDRPGHGLSDPQRGRTLLDWPDDVIELADVLQIDRFAVLGVSGGGPFAEACAFKIPDRLTQTAIVCGMGPAEAPGAKDGTSWTYAGKPALVRNILLKMMAVGMRRDPDTFQQRVLSQMNEVLPAPDADVLSDPALAGSFLEWTFGEALRSSIRGASRDAKLYSRPWGFRLEDIAGSVHLWHGELDRQVLPSVGHSVAEAIPNCHATFSPDDGHISLPRRVMRDVLRVLIAGDAS
jgi:pimeloyl-ACP methyl ester carboxylesterase